MRTGRRMTSPWLILALGVVLSGCQSDMPPAIYPPPLPKIPVTPDDFRALGDKAVSTPYDGEGFFVSIPATTAATLSPRDVHDGPVATTLKSLGIDLPAQALQIREESVQRPEVDIKDLARSTCRELLTYKIATSKKGSETDRTIVQARHVCAQLETGGELTGQIEAFFRIHYGMSFEQYVANLKLRENHYFFPQRVDGIPIEHTGILAAGWEGQTIRSVGGRVIKNYAVTNKKDLQPEVAAQKAREGVAKLSGISGVEQVSLENIELFLLPYGEAKVNGATRIALRYAYRMPVFAIFQKIKGRFLLWLDAETGDILELQSFIRSNTIAATGRIFHRSPDGPTEKVNFEIDPPTRGADGLWQYKLQLNGLLTVNGEDVTLPDTGNGVPPSNFDQPPITDGADPLDPQMIACFAGKNHIFERVDLLATLYQHLNSAKSTKLFESFPALDVYFNDSSTKCNARASLGGAGLMSSLHFGSCDGYFPNTSVPQNTCPNTPGQNLNTIHDHTWVAHELGHLLTNHLYAPGNRCAGLTRDGPCPVPIGQDLFHDFADSWAHALEDTDCFGGWYAKNQGGASDASKNCRLHSEAGGSPRKAAVALQFDAEKPGDHFPEHRYQKEENGKIDYADMQIAAAALWAVREGMRSKDPVNGTTHYFVRFARALSATGWFGQGLTAAWYGWIPGASSTASDLKIYWGLLDLETQLANQWATSTSPENGADTINKVMAGFARVGIFLIPPICIDGNGNTAHSVLCPDGESGADAVIDIAVKDEMNDLIIDAVHHPQMDHLRRSGPKPYFHIWTGPRYAFKDEDFQSPTKALCNVQVNVEVASDPDFKINRRQSGPLPVSPDASASYQCYVPWGMTDEDWKVLANAKKENGDSYNRIYYRATTCRTCDDQDKNKRISTEPGNGLFSVPPPYATVIDSPKS